MVFILDHEKLDVPKVYTAEQSINSPTTSSSAPHKVRGISNGPYEVVEIHPDSPDGDANLLYLDSDGNVRGRMGYHTHGGSNPHWKVYTETGTVGENPITRFQVGGGSGDTTTKFQNTKRVVKESSASNLTEELDVPSGYSSNLMFQTDGSTNYQFRYTGNQFRLQNLLSGHDAFRFFDNGTIRIDGQSTTVRHNGTDKWAVDWNGDIDHKQTESLGVVWETDTTANRPASPVTGQRFFDTDLGQPIWYDGTGWVDAQGNAI